MRFLFLKHSLAWPRSSGHEVYTFEMMKALIGLGHDVGLATVVPPAPAAVARLDLQFQCCLNGDEGTGNAVVRPTTRLQERFRRYYGVEQSWIQSAAAAAQRFRADAVVAVGLDVLPYLAAIHQCTRIWYAADEWVWHHLSQVRPTDRSSWSNVRDAAIKGVYERAHAGRIDRAWMVTQGERRAMRWLAGVRSVQTVPYGIDTELFAPTSEAEIARSAVFWGRLDFGPNIQALEWFCQKIWPQVRREVPDAGFTIIGFNPSDPVRRLADRAGIVLQANVPDLRPEVQRHALAVFPFVSGGGVKNKLLEAASLARPIVCTRWACGGLIGDTLPVVQVNSANDWVRALVELWGDAHRRRALGIAARQWVTKHHTWTAAAQQAVAGLESSHRERRYA